MFYRLRTIYLLFIILVVVSPVLAQGKSEKEREFSINSLEDILTRITFDKENSFDGKGSIKIEVPGPTIIRILEAKDFTGKIDQLLYKAYIKSELSEGSAFLEMWCHIPGKGAFFSRGLDKQVIGTADWVQTQTPFFLQGNPLNKVELNVVITGKGTIWVDHVELIQIDAK